jgi:hypothetical protein
MGLHCWLHFVLASRVGEGREGGRENGELRDEYCEGKVDGWAELGVIRKKLQS